MFMQLKIYLSMIPPYQGFFIFLTMVVKKEYMKGMRDQAALALSSYGITSAPTRGNDSSQVNKTVL